MNIYTYTGTRWDVLKEKLPYPLVRFLLLVKKLGVLSLNFLYDFGRYVQWSSAVNGPDRRGKLRAVMTMHYHNLEKGLSLATPRPGFGRPKARLLVAHVEEYVRLYGWDDYALRALSVLEAYNVFNLNHGSQYDDIVEASTKLRTLASTYGEPLPAGTRTVTKDEIDAAVAKVGEEFFSTRHSIRQFNGEPIDDRRIEVAVRCAQKAPAVCNRQSGRVWCIASPEKIARVLELQAGARGFERGIGRVLIVTAALENFQSVGERYQCWIDGGLFAMSLVLGLHAQGLGTCCLNWSKEWKADRRLHREFGIPDSEVVIMLIAVGGIPPSLQVAYSARKKIDEVLVNL